MTGFDTFVERLDYPVYVVTATADGESGGCLVGFAGQHSLDPPRFAVWISKANRTFRVARQAEVLVVHLLPSDRHDLAALFGGESGDHVDKFSRVAWTCGPDGTPVLEDCLAWFAGHVEDTVDWGDHVGFSLDPMTGEGGTGRAEGRPLFFRDVRDVTAGHPA